MNRTSWNLLLIIFLILHALVKFTTLSGLELQGDEAFSVFYSQQTISELVTELNKEANPPLYYIILHFWIKIFGIGLFSVKSIGFLISIGTAFFLFKLTQLFKNYWFTIFVSGYFLLSNVHYDFSHEIRAFQLVLLLTAASMFVFLKFIETNNTKWLVALSFITLALPYAHYNAVLVPVVQYLACLMFWNKEKRTVLKFTIAYACAALLFIPQYLVFRNAVPPSDFWLSLSNWEDLKFIANKVIGNDPGYYLIIIPYFIAPFIVFLGIRLKWFIVSFSYRTFFLFWTLYLIPLLLNFWLAQFIPSLQFKYILFVSFGAYLSVGYLLINLRKFNWISIAYISITLLQMAFFFNPAKRDGEGWNETAQMVRNFQKHKVAVVIHYPLKSRDLFYYYDQKAFADYRNIDKAYEKNGIFPIWNADEIDRLGDLKKYEKIILLLSHSDVHDPKGLIRKRMDTLLPLCYEIGDRIRAKVLVYNAGNKPCFSYKKIASKKLSSDNCWYWQKNLLLEEISGVKVDSYVLKFAKCRKMTVNDENSFSPGAEEFVKEVSIVDATVSFECKAAPTSMLVISVEKDGTSFKRAEYNLAEYFSGGKGRISVKSSVMGDYASGTVVKAYVWNPGGPEILIKEFEVQFWRK